MMFLWLIPGILVFLLVAWGFRIWMDIHELRKGRRW
jgi:hypothetical protein